MVAVVLPVNAAMVVTLQYSVGRRLNPANIRALMTAGTLCFVIGLVGFIFPATACYCGVCQLRYLLSVKSFNAPGEYMLIDHIAPPANESQLFFRPVFRLAWCRD